MSDYKQLRIGRRKAIRLKCLDCCAGQQAEVKLCGLKECPLWRYRMGHEEKDEIYYATHKPKENGDDVEDVEDVEDEDKE